MEKQLKAEIIKASDSIRKKFRLLKTDEREELETSKKHLAPLVTPLKTLIDLTKESNKKEPEIKVEPKIKVEPRVVISKTPRKNKKEDIEDDSLEEAIDTSDEEIYETAEPLTEDNYKQWSDYVSFLGPKSKTYLNGKMFDTRPGHFDSKFGVRTDPKNNGWKIGTQSIFFDKNDTIHIGKNMFHGTPGLFELLFKSFPNKKLFNDKDLSTYKEILQLTHAHFQEYNPLKKIASSSSHKYKNIISPLFKESRGGHLLPVGDNKIDYIHWNDPNELIERLELLLASHEGGNTGLIREIASIEEELREENIIE